MQKPPELFDRDAEWRDLVAFAQHRGAETLVAWTPAREYGWNPPERDWQQLQTAKNLAISVAVERDELLELVQWKTDAEIEESIKADDAWRRSFADEMADVFIYLVRLADVAGIDLMGRPAQARREWSEVPDRRQPNSAAKRYAGGSGRSHENAATSESRRFQWARPAWQGDWGSPQPQHSAVGADCCETDADVVGMRTALSDTSVSAESPERRKKWFDRLRLLVIAAGGHATEGGSPSGGPPLRRR